MKCFILFCAAFLISAIGAFAQRPDTARVLVYYKFSHIRDTTNRANPYTNEMVLQFGKSASAYKSSATTGFRAGGAEYYQFFRDRKLVRKESIMVAHYQINEDLPVIHWQVSPDTATFAGLHCQKATTHFKGRNYTAWFCPDLPVSAGPWKLNGLPGVIIEAFDTKKEVCFTFVKIEKLQAPAHQSSGNEPTIIKVPSNLTPTTEKEFARLQETFRKDPDAFIRMITGAGDGTGRQMHLDIKPGPPPVINNPIELPEKK
jgi:hypothetical protein